jgi:hypothetical protein
MVVPWNPNPMQSWVTANPVPPLDNGDRLDATEFLLRYDSMPGVKKAELIHGIVYMPSPVYIEQHGEPDSLAQGWLLNYAIATPGTRSATNSTTRLGPDDVPQPDGLLRILPECGGQSRVEDKILGGAPELAFEVAASSVSLDSHAKKQVYEAAGMREYILWRTLDGQVDWWTRREEGFVTIAPSEDGILRSEVFPGLWLDPAALVIGNGLRVMEVLNLGLASAAHGRFVEELRAATG